jgi:hypothetical protein
MGFMLAAVLAAAVGCGSSAPVSVTQFGEEWQQAVCRYRVRCGWMPDVDTCMAATRSPLTAQLTADIASGKVRYSSDGVPALIAAIDAVSCLRSDPHAIGASRARAISDAVIQGTVAPGGVCTTSEQCTQGYCSTSGDESCTPGTCSPAGSTVPAGGQCGLYDICADGTYCGPDPTTTATIMTCLPLPTAGHDCENVDLTGCAAGAACVQGNGAGNEICAALPGPSQTCDPSSDAFCNDYRDNCDQVTNTCQPSPGVGEPCSATVFCGDDATCDPTSNTCQLRGRAGDPCTQPTPTSFYPQCLGDLECDTTTNTCTLEPDPTPVCP